MQCLKGKSAACNRSKAIRERLSGEAVRKVNLTAQKINSGHVKSWSSFRLWYTYSGPATTPNRRSATVRFIMRYILRLRRWQIVAKAVIVMALMIDMTTNSVIRTGNHLVESSVAISVWTKFNSFDPVSIPVHLQMNWPYKISQYIHYA